MDLLRSTSVNEADFVPLKLTVIPAVDNLRVVIRRAAQHIPDLISLFYAVACRRFETGHLPPVV